MGADARRESTHLSLTLAHHVSTAHPLERREVREHHGELRADFTHPAPGLGWASPRLTFGHCVDWDQSRPPGPTSAMSTTPLILSNVNGHR